MPQGRHTGVKTEYSAATVARIAVLPRVHGHRANLRQEPCLSSRTSPGYGSWSKWAHSSLGSRSLCLGHSVLPLPCENRRLSMGRDIFFLPVRSYRRSIWVSVMASILLVLLQVGISGNLSLLVVQRAQHAAPPVGESFSTCRGIFLSW